MVKVNITNVTRPELQLHLGCPISLRSARRCGFTVCGRHRLGVALAVTDEGFSAPPA
jgi:hypothetical protein